LHQLRQPKPPSTILGQGTDPSASAAEQRARAALRQRAEAFRADDLSDLENLPNLVQAAFHDVAQAYSPDDSAALWRFTLPELLLLLEDFAQRLRSTVLVDFPVLRHIELSWVVKLVGLAGPVGKLMSVYRLLRWVNPSAAVLAELRGSLSEQAINGFGDTAKAQIGVIVIEQAGETAIKLYSGGYRRRADEMLATAPQPLPDMPTEPLTILLGGQRNAGKSALLNALLGKAREPVGLLTPTTAGCHAYEFQSERTGALILVDCPGTNDSDADPWLAQAAHSDLVIWVAAANRADRAADQRALDKLDAMAKRNPDLRPIPRILVLTQADKLDPPLEWAPPYDLEQGQRPKEEQMREARQAACEQLRIQPQHCALTAARPGQPLWNEVALYQAIQRVLPEARQKQLERGMARDGWFKRAKDTVASIPSTSDTARKLGGRVISGTWRKAADKLIGKGTQSKP
jgi:predicted GTPase